jgi:RNA polymerase sigma-70 factor (ECF subfamily)
LDDLSLAAREEEEDDERLERMPEYIMLLPEKCRRVFLLKFYNNLSYKQISSQLGISVKTVENHITKAFAIIRHKVGEGKVLLLLLGLEEVVRHV